MSWLRRAIEHSITLGGGNPEAHADFTTRLEHSLLYSGYLDDCDMRRIIEDFPRLASLLASELT